MGQLVSNSHLWFRFGSGNRTKNTGSSPSSTNLRGRLLRWRRLQSHSVDRLHRRFLRNPGSFRCISVDETRLLDLEFVIRHLVASGQFIQFLDIRAFWCPPERHFPLCHWSSPNWPLHTDLCCRSQMHLFAYRFCTVGPASILSATPWLSIATFTSPAGVIPNRRSVS